MIVKGTPEDSKLLRWLQSATADGKHRPTLSGIFARDGAVVGCDGFRIHAAKKPDCLPEGKILTGKVGAGDFVADMEEVDSDKYVYPDILQILPQSTPQFEIAADPKLLREALHGMERPVILKFHSQTTPLEVFSANDRYALIMPMHCDESRRVNSCWRPTSRKQQERTQEMAERVKAKLANAEVELANQVLTTAGGNDA